MCLVYLKDGLKTPSKIYRKSWESKLRGGVSIIYQDNKRQKNNKKDLFSKISQNSQEDTCAGISVQLKFQASGLHF